MASGTMITTYYLFKRPVTETGITIFGDRNNDGGESVYLKSAYNYQLYPPTGYAYLKVTEGEPWILVTVSNSIEGILESARIVARQIGPDNVMITKAIGIEQEIKLK